MSWERVGGYCVGEVGANVLTHIPKMPACLQFRLNATSNGVKLFSLNSFQLTLVKSSRIKISAQFLN